LIVPPHRSSGRSTPMPIFGAQQLMLRRKTPALQL
jgi:hypothetical protein